MKKILCLMILGLFVVSMVGVVGAQAYVAGKIIDGNGVPIQNTSVLVTCYKGDLPYPYIETETNEPGGYAVEFGGTTCSVGNTVEVIATEYVTPEYDASDEGVVDRYEEAEINLAIVNLTVPEFGFFIGILTLFAAVGVFFFVRRD